MSLRRAHLPADLSAYRLIHGDGEGLSGLALDRFGRYGVLYLYTPELERLVQPLCETVGPKAGLVGIYLQERFRPTEAGQPRKPGRLIWGRSADVEEIVTEGGLRFSVDVRSPLNVGLFCDHRPARALVRSLARGRRVLNLFSYTGAFSVAAAAGGASQVTSVDLSRRYQAWAKKNFGLNRLPVTPHEFLTTDVVGLLTRWARKPDRRYDLVILDPPTFSAGKKALSVRNQYAELVAACLGVLRPGGLLLASTNAHSLPEHDFWRLVAQGGAQAGRRLVVVQRLGLPPDFPIPPGFQEGAYLKTLLLQAD